MQQQQQEDDDKINNILDDIENEFKELDELMKEIDDLGIGEAEQQKYQGMGQRQIAPTD